MKKLLLILIILCLIFTSACSKPDKITSDIALTEDTSDIEIPTIKSSDQVMPIYFDISLYDEEDYAQIYLGKDFEFDFTYGGSNMKLPTVYSEISAQGWNIYDSAYNENSVIKAGETLEIQLVNKYNKQISATFYNRDTSSVKLSECPIVKFSVKENNSVNSDSVYDQFAVNGVSNFSAITDVINSLGAPSHFETFYENEYRLSYFVSKKDRRDKITVTVDVQNDCVKGIEVAKYN